MEILFSQMKWDFISLSTLICHACNVYFPSVCVTSVSRKYVDEIHIPNLHCKLKVLINYFDYDRNDNLLVCDKSSKHLFVHPELNTFKICTRQAKLEKRAYIIVMWE